MIVYGLLANGKCRFVFLFKSPFKPELNIQFKICMINKSTELYYLKISWATRY